MTTDINLSINTLQKAYASGETSPEQLIKSLLVEAKSLTAVWIHLLTETEIAPYLANLKNMSPETHPLYGVPFAIKDNIDLAGIPTTAACAEFAYTPEKSAFVVEELIAAGAIPLGKTNLDQFATGLVGTRSPYGATPNSFNPKYISGGSSSGSAVATAKGIVSFALGTDTAGSGRVPACFNNLVGLKPSKGLLSTSGVVPACRSLDCVSIFALTADDANTVFQVAAKYDEDDRYARKNIAENIKPVVLNNKFTFAIPKAEQLAFFGCDSYERAFIQAVTALEKLGGTKVELDFTPLLDAAKLLYEGPWVAERYIATQDILEEQPEVMMDVTRTIISQGDKHSAVDTFYALYRLQSLKKLADKLIGQVDVLVTPTAGRHFTLDEIAQEPMLYNSQLGYYTNFMNLLDYTAIAVPTKFTSKGLPFGVTLFSDAFTDQKLLTYAKRIQDDAQLSLGATGWTLPKTTLSTESDAFIDVVVCGAHLSGMALNWQLTDRKAVLIEQTQSAAKYQMYSIAGEIERPAMIRNGVFDQQKGTSFEVEVWRLPIEAFGSFVAGIAQPLGIGKVELADGRWLTGFIAEGHAAAGNNISSFGSWRAYKAQTA
ncbi:allophanate hydrolase [Colwellia echini]|uniref:Allophanate hydrolase n=1 Tax=Colwellia echini TaxID=1982103 RepID=A0ABY3MZM9_9GAMM|nr:allophanate hydrolase [Colwellia echini]TYK66629.1 allophanate hydrolase [Colwellia echini]